MSKTIPILTFILLLSNQNLCSQEWAPLGAKWIYNIQFFETPLSGPQYEEWQVTGDTIIMGIETRKIERVSEALAFNPISVFYTYEENDTAYFFNEALDQFEIWFDFSAEQGDSWSNHLDTCGYEYTVDTVVTSVIDGSELDVLLYSRESNFFDVPGSIIKYIGDYGFIPYNLYECENSPVDGQEYSGLNCYEDSIIVLVNFRPNTDFYSPNFISSIQEFQKIIVGLFPNPVLDDLNIELPINFTGKFEIKIFDQLGREMIKKQFANKDEYKINLSTLSNGIYICHGFNSNGGSFFSELLLIDK